MDDRVTADEVRELLAGATPGEWDVDFGYDLAMGCRCGSCYIPTGSVEVTRLDDAPLTDADRRVIAAAPRLARTVIANADELAAVRAELAALRGGGNG